MGDGKNGFDISGEIIDRSNDIVEGAVELGNDVLGVASAQDTKGLKKSQVRA